MSELVLYGKDGDVAVITINNPPVNALSPGVPEGIVAGVERANADPEVRAVVIIGSGRTFIAGADIREFAKLRSAPSGEHLAFYPKLLSIEDSAKPVVMAIHGTALGGGLEVAMSGHYRVAVASAQVGQPEVKLGLIPGAAGTQRLPRLAGVAKAAEMPAFGDPIGAKDALACGVIDRIVDGDLLAGAIAFAREAAGRTPPKAREQSGKLGDPVANAPVLAGLRDAARKRLRGQAAPLAAIHAVEIATTVPFDEGCRKEGDLFQQCLHSDQSKAMIHAFFGERTVTRIPDIPKDTRVLPIRKAAVIGAGTMGGGISMVYANAGIPVLMKESSQEALDKGLATIRKNYANSVKRGRFTQEEADRRLALITPALSYNGFEDADIVVEAVFENMALKKQIFGELDQIARPDAILAMNTSSLNIDAIASATKRPEMVIGHHYFSPANVMRLLEIVRGRSSSKETIATSMDLARKLKKVGVLVGSCRGFVGNRMFAPYRREAQFLVEEGATPELIDRSLYEFGMAMGPLSTGDLAGLDVGWRVRQEYKHTEIPGVRYPAMEDRLCERGHYGQKTGLGWYRYDENRNQSPNPEVAEIAAAWREQTGTAKRDITPEECVERCIYVLVNEGAKILDEGIAMRAVDIDIIYLNGYGFPIWRGGPMCYADLVGLPTVYERILQFHKQHGHHWEPAPLLKRLVEEGKTFAAWDEGRG